MYEKGVFTMEQEKKQRLEELIDYAKSTCMFLPQTLSEYGNTLDMN